MNTKIAAKVHQVSLDGVTYLVEAQTKAGAIRDVIEVIVDGMRKRAIADLATGEQLYHAGVKGLEIIGSGRFKNAIDPRQMGLTGIPETEGELS